MKPYIITHMMTSVDGRIDCPMVGQLSTDEYSYKLKLESVEQWDTGIVWLRYKVKK